MQLTLILLSPRRCQGGNFHTINRISSYLGNHGNQCHIEDPMSFKSVEEFQKYLKHKRVDMVIGIHAYRSGVLLRASTVPFILILGGTDVNEFHTDIDKLSVMTEAVCNAKYIIVFGKSLLSRALKIWPDINRKKIKEIKQAVITQPSTFSLLKYLKSHNHIPACSSSHDEITIFLFVGGIRPVKDPLFLIEKFTDWHKEDNSILYVIVGPKIDEEYFEKSFWPVYKRSSGVVYIPGLPIEDTHAAIRDCFSLVNSSKSEGMSLAVLEAMKLEVPVLARNVTGNKDLVEDGETGLLYDTPEEFVVKARSIMASSQTRDHIVSKATDHVIKHHTLDVEGQAYMSLVTS